MNNPVTLGDPSGKFAWAPIAVGAAIGAVIGGVQAYQQTGDIGRTAAGAAIGAAAGAGSAVAIGGTVATMAMGAGAGFFSNLATQVVVVGRGTNIDWGSAVISAGAGAAGGYAAKWTTQWIGRSPARLAAWLRNNAVSFDDEIIEAGVSALFGGGVDYMGQAAWSRTPWAVQSTANPSIGHSAPVLPVPGQPSK